MPPVRTERGLDRLVNFSDAVVAIAITLLVLPLVDAAPSLADRTLGEFLRENLSMVLAFGLSFMLISRYWLRHHLIFEHVRDYDATLARLNVIWLAVVVLVPFTQYGLSAAQSSRPDLDGMYIGNLLAISVATVVLERYLVRHPELLRDNVIHDDIRPPVVEAVLLALVLVLAVLVPRVGPGWLVLLLLPKPIRQLSGRLRVRRRG